jgi:hypothetical protein
MLDIVTAIAYLRRAQCLVQFLQTSLVANDIFWEKERPQRFHHAPQLQSLNDDLSSEASAKQHLLEPDEARTTLVGED